MSFTIYFKFLLYFKIILLYPNTLEEILSFLRSFLYNRAAPHEVREMRKQGIFLLL